MDFVEKSVDNFEVVKEKISNHTVWCMPGVGRSHFPDPVPVSGWGRVTNKLVGRPLG